MFTSGINEHGIFIVIQVVVVARMKHWIWSGRIEESLPTTSRFLSPRSSPASPREAHPPPDRHGPHVKHVFVLKLAVHNSTVRKACSRSRSSMVVVLMSVPHPCFGRAPNRFGQAPLCFFCAWTSSSARPVCLVTIQKSCGDGSTKR